MTFLLNLCEPVTPSTNSTVGGTRWGLWAWTFVKGGATVPWSRMLAPGALSPRWASTLQWPSCKEAVLGCCRQHFQLGLSLGPRSPKTRSVSEDFSWFLPSAFQVMEASDIWSRASCCCWILSELLTCRIWEHIQQLISSCFANQQ